MNGRGSVLISDDEVGPRESLRMILKPIYDVHTTSSGQEALEILNKESIDVATVDLKMPEINGIEVLKEAKKIKPDIEVIIVTAYGSLHHAIEAIRYGAIDFLSKPYNAAEIIAVVGKAMERRHFNRKIKNLVQKIMDLSFTGKQVPYEALSNLGASLGLRPGLPEIRQELSESLENWNSLRLPQVSVNYMDFLKVLVYILDNKEPYTSGHSERVSIYSEIIAQEMNLSAQEKESLQISALLHDIGKIGIANHVLENINLTQMECLDIQQHPVKGIHLIEPLAFPPAVTRAIRHHHERWDGRGYPDGLAGLEIPLLARIICLADSYDAMTSDRPYRPGLPPQDVLDEIERNSGRQFDPEIVALFSNFSKKERTLPLIPSYFPPSLKSKPDIARRDGNESFGVFLPSSAT